MESIIIDLSYMLCRLYLRVRLRACCAQKGALIAAQRQVGLEMAADQLNDPEVTLDDLRVAYAVSETVNLSTPRFKHRDNADFE